MNYPKNELIAQNLFLTLMKKVYIEKFLRGEIEK